MLLRLFLYIPGLQKDAKSFYTSVRVHTVHGHCRPENRSWRNSLLHVMLIKLTNILAKLICFGVTTSFAVSIVQKKQTLLCTVSSKLIGIGPNAL